MQGNSDQSTMTSDQNQEEIVRLNFIEQSLLTKISILNEQYLEVKRQLQYLQKNNIEYSQLEMQVEVTNSVVPSYLETPNPLLQYPDTPSLYLNSLDMCNKYQLDYMHSFDTKYEGGVEDQVQIREEEEQQQPQGYQDDDEEEEDDDEEVMNKNTQKNYLINQENNNINNSNFYNNNFPYTNNVLQDSSLFQLPEKVNPEIQLEMSQLFPKLLKQRKSNKQKCENEDLKQKRLTTHLDTKKIYPFKKMKVQTTDEPNVVVQKIALRDKYDKFLDKLRQEMPYYISEYGQIRYPDYVKKKVALFCRYISRTKLVEDTKIGAEAVAKWVKFYSNTMDDKLENNEPHETFEEYIKQRQSKSAYLVKKQQLNCLPNLNQATLKQVEPAVWQKRSYEKPQNKEKFKFKMN